MSKPEPYERSSRRVEEAQEPSVGRNGAHSDAWALSPATSDEPVGDARFAPASDDHQAGTIRSLSSAVPVNEAIAEAELADAPEDLPPPPSPVPVWRTRLGPSVPISCGAVLGANARYLVGQWAVARWPGPFPWGTLLINITGSLIIGFYLTLVTERFAGRATTRLFIATGFLGAYTTFSTFSYETVTLVRQGMIGAAILYVVASLVLGLTAVVVGTLVAHAL